MKRKVLPLFLVFCIATVFISIPKSVTPVSASIESQVYDFPIKLGTDEWKSLKNLEEKIEACHVPEEIILNMKTEHLIETVLNYPLLGNIYFYNTIDEGIKEVSSYFEGLKELMKRPDAADKLLEAYDKEMNSAEALTSSSNKKIRLMYLKTLIDQVYLNNNENIGIQAEVETQEYVTTLQ